MSLNQDLDSERTVRALRAFVADRGPALVTTHDNPDPDALSAALTITEALRALGAPEVVPAFRGLLGRPENEAMVDVLGLPFTYVDDLDTAHFDYTVLVDVQPGAGNVTLPARPPVQVVIDHHPLREESLSLPVQDVRPWIGSSATIAYHLLNAAGGKPGTELATALVYGIKTDTQDFSRVATPLDIAAYRALIPDVDYRKLAQIERPPLSPRHFEVLRRALERAYVYGDVLLTTVESLPHSAAAAEVADLLLRTEGVTWSACVGIVGDSVCYSIRTADPQGHAGEIAAQVARPGGSGGGHWPMAAGRIPRQAFPETSVDRVLDEMIRRLVVAFGVENEPPRKLLRWRARAPRTSRASHALPVPHAVSADTQSSVHSRT